ncbi:DMT family transporter [Dapis sp. BLCC M229]|uniref:DMT family transporter n=1 Tax=Dapis sp. BLCC M229 TaxID=3400188 RepID=UPI003CECBB37
MQQNRLNREQLQAIAATTISLIVLAISPIFIKLVEYELSANATIFNYLVGAAIFFGMGSILSRLRSKKSNKSLAKETTRKDYLLLFAAGLCFWATQVSWAWSLSRTSIAISELLHNFTPLFVILGSWLIGRQQFNLKFLLGTGLSIIGSCLIGIEHLSYLSGQIQGDIAAILSATFLAAYMIIGETLCQKFSKSTIMFWVCTTGSLLSVPILFIAKMQWFPLSFQGWVFAICLVLTMVLGQGLRLYAIEQVGANLLAVLLLLIPVIAAVIAWLIFSEILSYLDWAAMAIVLLGVYLSTSKKVCQKFEQKY